MANVIAVLKIIANSEPLLAVAISSQIERAETRYGFLFRGTRDSVIEITGVND
jgi:hypothetical protein